MISRDEERQELGKELWQEDMLDQKKGLWQRKIMGLCRGRSLMCRGVTYDYVLLPALSSLLLVWSLSLQVLATLLNCHHYYAPSPAECRARLKAVNGARCI